MLEFQKYKFLLKKKLINSMAIRESGQYRLWPRSMCKVTKYKGQITLSSLKIWVNDTYPQT